MSTQKLLRLLGRFEPPHPSPPYPGCLVQLLSPIIIILLRAVDHLRHQLSMGHTVAAQVIGHNFSGFTAMTVE
jgi:hypothetical protein